MKNVYLDVTELVANPIQTGIQRIERQCIRHWPKSSRLVPICFDVSAGFLELDTGLFEEISSGNEDIDGFSQYRNKATILDLATDLTILNLELFFDKARADYYIGLPSKVAGNTFFLVNDFLPYLSPQYFANRATRHCMWYIKVLRSIQNVAFISAQTRRDFFERILRSPSGGEPVFTPGGDGISLERQRFHRGRRSFAVVGTIEPRKQVADVLNAFRILWDKGVDAELFVVGRMMETATVEQELLAKMRDDPRLHYRAHTSDDQMQHILRQVRATIFVSKAEGFGIPPIESLAAGIPTICSAHCVPSLETISHHGQVRLDSPDPSAIAKAVESIMDDKVGQGLWDDAAVIEIPKWSDFANGLAHWVNPPAGPHTRKAHNNDRR